jgi:thiol-disulfide isomerase/thioredoxin
MSVYCQFIISIKKNLFNLCHGNAGEKMKKIWFLFVPLFLSFVVSGTITAQTSDNKAGQIVIKKGNDSASPDIDFYEQSTWVLGYFKLNRLTAPPYSTWFLKGYDEYQPADDVLARLRAKGTDSITITIVLGTWCPDSRRETPQFMKILDAWDFPGDKVTFIGVDDLKQSPIGDYDKLGIVRVPTFIIYKNNIEAGRIIEHPVSSLEQDMLNILGRNE